jgi:hypothetical protein
MDNRPDIWLGHCSLKTSDLDGSHDFMIQIGLRPVFKNEEITILELRGGTHLIMSFDESAEGGEAKIDFMVEDINATYSSFTSLGLKLSEMSRGSIHDSFVVSEPGGNQITVNSTHVDDHGIV